MTKKIKTTWRKAKLENILQFIIDHRGKTPKKMGSDWSVDGIPAISAKNIKNGKIVNRKDIRYVSQEIYNKWMSEKLEKGDILLTSEAPLGELLYLREKTDYCLSQRLFALRTQPQKLYSRFLYYYLLSPIGQHQLARRISGTAAEGIKQAELKQLEVFFPESIDEQKRIASILSAFDDKIELNNKISRTLEQMAQAIFKEWFIKKSKFKNQNAKFWKEGNLGDEIYSEIIKPGIRKFSGEKIYLATADVVKNEIVNNKVRITYNNRPIRANCEPVLNSIWFAKMINTYKVLAFFEGNKNDVEKYILSTGFMGIKALKGMEYYLYLFINSEHFHSLKDTLVQGAVQEAITNTNVKEIKILIPPENIINEFNEKVEPLIIKIFQIKKENQKLAALRDLLLPKLMSGEIKV